MSNKVLGFKPPRRFVVEIDTNDYGDEVANVIEVTGEQDPVYMQGYESPWLGLPLKDILNHAEAGEYGECSVYVRAECYRLMKQEQ